MQATESATSQPGYIDVRSSDDIHEQAALLDTWNQEYCQISSGQFDGSVTSIRANGIRFFVEHMNRAVLQKGDVGSQKLALGIPLKLAGQSVLCGETSCRDSLHVFSGPSGFEYLSPDNFIFIGLEITLPNASSSKDEELLVRELQSKLQQGRRVIPVQKSQAHLFRSSLRSMFYGLKANPSALSDPISLAALERASFGGVLELLSHREAETPSGTAATASSWRLASQARALVEDSPDCPMSVVELALRLGVSRRTIQYACQNALGAKPTSYLRAVRLSGVRRELRMARSVTEAATRWGFWHLSNFARDYCAMFGELPSQTLKRMNSKHTVSG